ncbi:hypothetical protein C8R43DRAFT_1234559 [Mycena crocata]|nr:hypothetical protein C8R43DRAFT_1234559 [Mycena crocata]
MSFCPACKRDAIALRTPLAIAEHGQVKTRGVDAVLITDDLLRFLTHVPDIDTPALVPKRNVLHMHSHLCFTDTIYLVSIQLRLTSECVYTVELDALPQWKSYCRLDADVWASLRELELRPELAWTLVSPLQ